MIEEIKEIKLEHLDSLPKESNIERILIQIAKELVELNYNIAALTNVVETIP
jgi:hypothetical protein